MEAKVGGGEQNAKGEDRDVSDDWEGIVCRETRKRGLKEGWKGGEERESWMDGSRTQPEAKGERRKRIKPRGQNDEARTSGEDSSVREKNDWRRYKRKVKEGAAGGEQKVEEKKVWRR